MSTQRRVFYLGIALLFISTAMVFAAAQGATRYRARVKSATKIEGQRPRGRAVWTQHKNGRTRLKIRLQQIPGLTVDVTACGAKLVALPVSAGKVVRFILDTKNSDTVPACAATLMFNVTGSSGLNMTGSFEGRKK